MKTILIFLLGTAHCHFEHNYDVTISDNPTAHFNEVTRTSVACVLAFGNACPECNVGKYSVATVSQLHIFCCVLKFCKILKNSSPLS